MVSWQLPVNGRYTKLEYALVVSGWNAFYRRLVADATNRVVGSDSPGINQILQQNSLDLQNRLWMSMHIAVVGWNHNPADRFRKFRTFNRYDAVAGFLFSDRLNEVASTVRLQ